MNEYIRHLDLEQAKYLSALIKSDLEARKNHIASAVENPEHWGDRKAVEMVKELRKAEKVYATVNGAILREEGVIK